ncbi:hypothetical protein AURDEDRAFT_182956 [Auricularia subglabra TFB-10046 SS5]|nr:hypothetical protein AURDEDRAFT_182956 [Auricularia subglabra TFB-10046 SS5]
MLDGGILSPSTEQTHEEPQRPGIHVLPPELLCDIFAAIDDYADLITSTHVCKHWRSLSLSNPGRLWSEVRTLGSAGVFTEAMARTQQAPADVAAVVRKSNAEEVANVLTGHLSHIQKLSLQFDEELDLDFAERIAHALSLPAPLLHRLVILDVHDVLASGFDSGQPCCDLNQLFNGQAPPNLSTVKLFCSSRPYTALPAFSNVRQVMYASNGIFLLPAELTAVLHWGTFENLELLALEFDHWDALPEHREPLPPSLKCLVLSIEDPETNAVDLLHALDNHKHVPHIRIQYNNGCDPDVGSKVLEYVLPSAGGVVELIIDSSESDLALFEAVPSRGFRREVYDVPPVLSEGAFDHLTRLSVSEWEWTGIDPYPAAPLLTHLTLRLVAPQFVTQESMHRSVFVDLDAGGVLHAPRLHTFAVSTRRSGDPALLGMTPALAPEMVVQFLTARLVYDAGKLPVLFLNGVGLLENLVEHVIELLDLVEEVQCGPGHFHPSDPLTDLVNWE